MKRISIQELRPGAILDQPIYTRDRRLLLAKGLPFTEEMSESLRDTDWRFVFIGEWSEADALRYDRAIHLQSYRAEAERVADALLYAFQHDLTKADLRATPTGTPMEEMVNRLPAPRRSRQSRTEFERTRGEAAALVEGICEGLIPPVDVADAADKVLNTVISQFCSDPSLAANLLQLKGADNYLYTHSLNRTVLSVHIAAAMGYSRKQILDIAVSALVADVGMSMLPQSLVNLPRRLTADEYAAIQRHCLYSLHVIQKMPKIPVAARFVAYQLHERYDGSGYPGHRRQQLIHQYAAIVAVADAYDALTSVRPWRPAFAPYLAMETIIKEASRGKYDREAVRGLLQYLSLFPVGSLVRLNSGAVGKVIHATGRTYDRPVVAILFDRGGGRRNDGEVVNLADHAQLKIDGYVEGDLGVTVGDGF